MRSFTETDIFIHIVRALVQFVLNVIYFVQEIFSCASKGAREEDNVKEVAEEATFSKCIHKQYSMAIKIEEQRWQNNSIIEDEEIIRACSSKDLFGFWQQQ
ncbi:hypothetical protein ABK040_009518 [Willaertia magna]